MTSIEITHTMRAVVFDRYGDPCVLREARVPMPTLRPGGVLIRVRAIGVNPADGKWRSGMFAGVRPLRLPHVGGYDIAGEVVSADADWLAPGMRVVAMLDALTQGAYADYAVADRSSVAAIPDRLSFERAAALPTPGLTGIQMIEEQLDVQPGHRVLLTGATGAVGRFALQAALGRSATVVAAVRDRHVSTARALGATQTIVLGQQSSMGAPFDHVADTVGGAAVADLCRHVHPAGRIRTVATTPIQPDGLPVPPIFFGVRPDARQLDRLAVAVADGSVAVEIADCLPLVEAAEAQRRLEAGRGGGKIILIP